MFSYVIMSVIVIILVINLILKIVLGVLRRINSSDSILQPKALLEIEKIDEVSNQALYEIDIGSVKAGFIGNSIATQGHIFKIINNSEELISSIDIIIKSEGRSPDWITDSNIKIHPTNCLHIVVQTCANDWKGELEMFSLCLRSVNYRHDMLFQDNKIIGLKFESVKSYNYHSGYSKRDKKIRK